jgi:hypothetical protein
VNALLADTGLNISSFGEDEQNELYFCSLNGKIYFLRANVIAGSPSPTQFSTPSPNQTQPPASTPTPMLTPTSSPTSIPNPSQSPLPSPTQVTSTPKPPSSVENSLLIYTIIISVALASIGATIFFHKKRQRKRRLNTQMRKKGLWVKSSLN